MNLHGYVMKDASDYQHDPSMSVGGLTSFSCERLGSPCSAPAETLDLCFASAELIHGMNGREVSDVWNELTTD